MQLLTYLCVLKIFDIKTGPSFLAFNFHNLRDNSTYIYIEIPFIAKRCAEEKAAR